MRVLVVEDDDLAADLLRRLLQAHGYAVRMAGCYKQALQTAAHWLPDLLVTDICLPDKDGLEVLRRMRSAYPTLKGIAVSGCTAPADVSRVYEAGFAAYLPKPLSADQLENAIRRVLADEL